jgi:hypothetical protein
LHDPELAHHPVPGGHAHAPVVQDPSQHEMQDAVPAATAVHCAASATHGAMATPVTVAQRTGACGGQGHPPAPAAEHVPSQQRHWPAHVTDAARSAAHLAAIEARDGHPAHTALVPALARHCMQTAAVALHEAQAGAVPELRAHPMHPGLTLLPAHRWHTL